MALNRSLVQMRDGARKLANVQGASALQRHPDADVNDYVNRGLGSLHRKLTEAVPDQRFLSSTTVTTVAGTLTYSLPATFDHLISIDLTANGIRSWLVAYEMHERPMLVDPSASYTGVPFCYRLRGSNIELLPEPNNAYDCVLWYVPTSSQLTGDSQTYDTISRLDDYVMAYAARLIAMKEKAWDLVAACKDITSELSEEIAMLARSRDKNSPSRVVDEMQYDRFGRRARLPRRWR